MVIYIYLFLMKSYFREIASEILMLWDLTAATRPEKLCN